MINIHLHPVQILLICLMVALATPQVHFSLNEPVHLDAPRRHQLNDNHNDFVIHHNMRVFNFKHQSNLQHEAVGQNYGLNDMGYFFTLNLTVANLPYSLNIDTGSSDLFIKGEHSKGNPQNKYTCRRCMRKNKKVSIAYLDGQLSTYKATLPIQLGQHKFNQSILVAFSAPHNFYDASGLVGLSFPQLARNRDPTFLQTLINNKIISSYSFGVNLNFQQHKRSFISFGAFDSALFQGELKKYSLLVGYSYRIQVKGVSVGDGDLLQINSAIFDTGNTCISIPIQFQESILSKVNTKNNICGFDNQQHAPQFSLLRCKVKDYNELPTFKIHIGQEIYQIDKDVYMQRCIKQDTGDLCDTFIESVKMQQEVFLGDGFFNRYYTYFDIENRQIGIAKNKEVLSHQNMFIDGSIMDGQDKTFFSSLQLN